MPGLIDYGCSVADVYRRYHDIHGAIFGAASYRIIIDALRGRRRRIYHDHAQVLVGLRAELAGYEREITDLVEAGPMKATDREIHRVLLDYLRVLDGAINDLFAIFDNLQRDETRYRDVGADGHSRFSNDKRLYDRHLSELERLGTRLNRLFTSY